MASSTSFQSLLSEKKPGTSRVVGLIVAFLGMLFTLTHIYTGIYGMPDTRLFSTIHLCLAMAILYLVHPLGRRWDEPLNKLFIVDAACVAGCMWLLGYALVKLDDVDMLYVRLGAEDYVTIFLLIGLIFEAIRRTVGWSLVIISAFFFLQALNGELFPGVFNTPNSSLQTLLQNIFIGNSGIYGVPLMTVVQYIVLFLLFGKLLQATGVGSFFARIAFSVFGHRTGGPAKAAVASSALFGTVSGSGVSNVLTTGAFTIPMMRRLGYAGPFAGGVEAASAVGGAIMPPIMGAVAFMMAEFMGVAYRDVIIAAIIPAILYFFVIYLTVHVEARKKNLARMNKEQLPSVRKVLLREGYLAIPLLLIIVMLLLGYSIVLVALITSLAAVLISFINRATFMSPSRLGDVFESTARTSCVLSVTCACAGVIIASIFTSGLSFQVTQSVMSIAGDQLWLLLLVSGLVAIILGTGLTASAVYITMVATIIPLLRKAGVPDMGAHMFAFYFGVVSDITPPTALAAVAAAGLARANPMATMISASRIGIAAFIVPVVFVYSPALLMNGTPLEIATASIFAGLGLYGLVMAMAGHHHGTLNGIERLALFAGSGCLIVPGLQSALVGIVLLLIGLVPDILRSRQSIRRDTHQGSDPAIAVRLKMPLFLERWLESRIAREQKELNLPNNDENDEGSQNAALADYLEREALENRVGPPDAGRWGAWLVIAGATLATGYAGSMSLHARDTRVWLAVMAMISVFLLVGLLMSLRGVGFSAESALQLETSE